MNKFLWVQILCGCILWGLLIAIPVDPTRPIPVRNEDRIKFAFGSCFKFAGTESGEIFDNIGKEGLDVFAWFSFCTLADF